MMPFFRLPGKPASSIALVVSPRARTAADPANVPKTTEIALNPLRGESQGQKGQKDQDSQDSQETPGGQGGHGLFSDAVSPDRSEFPSPSPSPTSPNRGRADSVGFSPVRRIATTYRIRSSRPKNFEYGMLPTDEEQEGAGTSSDMYLVDEDTLVSQQPRGRNRRRRWMVGGMVCGLTLLAVLLILSILLYASRSVYAVEADPDAIFSNWGLPGTGTEDLAWYPTDFLRDVVPIPCHSHNDYWRKVPLFSALHAGCVGTEVDLWLANDNLFVGHERAALTPNRTFQSLYLDPLTKILERANPSTQFSDGNQTLRGVFDTSPNQTLALLVDIKTDGASTFRKVLEQIEPLRKRGWLSTFENGKVAYGPITLVGSGNTPFDVVVENGTYRYAFFDAPLNGLENSVFDLTNSYYASAALGSAVGRVWFGAMRRGQLRRMRYQLQQAHARGLKARYWDLPAWPINLRDALWGTLVSEGVDLLNVDDINAATRSDWTKTSWV